MPRHRVMLACCCLPLLAPVLLAVAEPGSSPAKAPPKPKEQLVAPDAARPTEPAHAGDAPASSSSSSSSTSSVALLTATPKGALKLLAAALRDGDAERIRQVMYASNASEARMVAAMADMAKAMAALQRSAVKAFGREGAKEVVGDTDATDTESKAHIDSADVKVQGDTATVTMEDGEEAPVVLKRVDGRWRLPMSELSRGADLAALEERLAGLSEQSKLVRELAEEIGTGKYASPAQAKEAWQSRAMQASMRRPPAARAAEKKPEAQRKRIEDRG
jgi:hypothetical protein